MTIELTVLIPSACAVLGAVIGFATFSRNNKKDVETLAKSDGYFAAYIEEIKKKLDKLEDRVQKISDRLAIIEGMKQAYKRSDREED